jgi:hypothetical protein
MFSCHHNQIIKKVKKEVLQQYLIHFLIIIYFFFRRFLSVAHKRLEVASSSAYNFLVILGRRQVVRHWSLAPACGGSNPSAPAILLRPPEADFGGHVHVSEMFICRSLGT